MFRVVSHGESSSGRNSFVAAPAEKVASAIKNKRVPKHDFQLDRAAAKKSVAARLPASALSAACVDDVIDRRKGRGHFADLLTQLAHVLFLELAPFLEPVFQLLANDLAFLPGRVLELANQFLLFTE